MDEQNIDITFLEAEEIKQEYDDTDLECTEMLIGVECMSMYTEHIIKDEIVIGPEVLIKPYTSNDFNDVVDKSLYKNVSPNIKPNKPSKWVCQCKKVFQRKGALTKHVKFVCPMNLNKIIINKWYTCDVCNKDYGRKDILQKHIQTHMKLVKYQCDCGKEYATKDGLRNHVNVKHLNKKNDTVCYLCNKDLNDKTYRNYHIKHSCPMNNNRIKCPKVQCNFCHKVLSAKSAKAVHIKVCPKNPNVPKAMLPCDYCNMLFLNNSHRDRHIKYDCSMNEKKIKLKKKFLCKFCYKVFSIKANRDLHMNYVCSLNENKIIRRETVCNFCNKVLSDKYNRNYHMKYTCPLNKNKITLKEAMCPLCNKEFSSKSNRDRHISKNICSMIQKK